MGFIFIFSVFIFILILLVLINNNSLYLIDFRLGIFEHHVKMKPSAQFSLLVSLPGEKPFECRLCGQRSRDYSAMIKHLRTHGGATPYQCTLCLEFCSSLAAMQKHLKNHPTQDFPPDWSLNSTYLYICHT